MLARPLLNHILHNDHMTRGLADPEARMLVEWVVERAERGARSKATTEEVRHNVETLCRRARTIGRFVTLWCHTRERGAACQLAAAEHCGWPLPTDYRVDPCELMQSILYAETREVKCE